MITSIPIKSKGGFKYYISNWIDITERKAIEKSIQLHQKKLENSEKELQRFSRKILSIREEEKKNISSMLHDEVGCMVVVLSSGIAAIEEEIKNKNYKKSLKVISKCKKSLKRYSSNLRKIAVELRPPDLNIVGLPEALKEYLSDLKKNNQIKIDFQVDMDGMSIDEEVAIVLYRIAQESLTNVIKHAEAKKVDVKIYGSDNTIRLLIRDDGKGFDLKKKSRLQGKHLGLRSMKEMIESLNGVFHLESGKNAGTEIAVSIPLEKRGGP